MVREKKFFSEKNAKNVPTVPTESKNIAKNNKITLLTNSITILYTMFYLYFNANFAPTLRQLCANQRQPGCQKQFVPTG